MGDVYLELVECRQAGREKPASGLRSGLQTQIDGGLDRARAQSDLDKPFRG
jgi:hypothetical protein